MTFEDLEKRNEGVVNNCTFTICNILLFGFVSNPTGAACELTVGSSNHFTQNGISLFTKLFSVMTFHVLFKVTNIVIFGVANGTNVF